MRTVRAVRARANLNPKPNPNPNPNPNPIPNPSPNPNPIPSQVPEAHAAVIAELCGCMPLALRLCGCAVSGTWHECVEFVEINYGGSRLLVT